MKIALTNWFCFAFILLVGCKKDSEQLSNLWTLADYKVSYYNESDQKIFEEKPESLKEFDNVILSENEVKFETNSVSKKETKNNKPNYLLADSTYFKGIMHPAKNAILLQWGTTFETNNSYFELYKYDLGGINELVILDTIKGINNVNHYTYIDREPDYELNYYALKQIYLDTTYTYWFGLIGISYIPNQSHTIINIEDKEYLSFEVGGFQNVEIIRNNNREMKWEAKEENIQYTENDELKTAAYAKLEMRFTR